MELSDDYIGDDYISDDYISDDYISDDYISEDQWSSARILTFASWQAYLPNACLTD